MSRRRSQSTPPPGLSVADIARLDSQLPDIASAVRERPCTRDGSGWRVGSSSKIWRNAGWYDHKLKVSGRGTLSYVRHYRNCSLDEAIAWARDWLAHHPDTGPCTGNDDSDETSDDEVERTTYVTSLYDSGHPIEHTPAGFTSVGETSIRRSSRLRLSPLCAGFPTCGAKKVGSSPPSPTKWGPSPPFISPTSRRKAS